jgi:pimeloyl-ACP methyl ester carboxylesterase
MDAQLARTLIGAYVGSADLGESIATARRVPAGAYDAWHHEWSASANKALEHAETAADSGLHDQAGKAFLRASEYHRQAYFFLRHDLDDDRVIGGYRAQRDAFRRAIPHLPFQVDEVQVEFDPAPLRGYVFRPEGGRHGEGGRRDEGEPRPMVIFPGGFDGTAEEMHKYGARQALALGWNAIVFDGPGQGGLLVEGHVPMRPDFEAVLTPLIDWTVTQPYIDPSSIIVIGRSFGGYLAPRAAATERRIRALVCDPGQFDFTSRFVDMFSPEDWQRVRDSEPEMEAQLEGFLSGARNLEFYGARMKAMGAETFGGWLRTMIGFTLEGVVDGITCATLVTEGEGDFASQSSRLFESLKCDRQLKRFTIAEGAGGHCEGMGQAVWGDFVFSWLWNQLAP